MDQWAPYGVTAGGVTAFLALLRWLYVLLVRGLATENARLTARLSAAQDAEQQWRDRAQDAGWTTNTPSSRPSTDPRVGQA